MNAVFPAPGFVSPLISPVDGIMFLMALVCVCAVADDWPNWRGPQHNGISYEVNWGGDWATCEPNVLWEQIGAVGGHLGLLDGSVYWKHIRDMKIYRGSRQWDDTGCYTTW